MQTVIGSTGIIGRLTAKELIRYTDKIRLVSRNPVRVNNSDELLQADVTDINQMREAVSGSDVVYMTIGLAYNIKIWETQWPVIIRNVITACLENNSKLVFFDNIYSLGYVNGWMKEDTIMKPVSRKGYVRKKLTEMIINAVEKNNLNAIILRGADFYGYNTLSFINLMVFERLSRGKKPQWLVNDMVKHSFTYTPDAGRAMAILGNTPDAYNQIWHAPTDNDVLNGKEIIALCEEAFGVKTGYSVIKKPVLKLIGLFNINIKESIEMLYQNEFDYLFDSSKFEKRFNIKPTMYKDGIYETTKFMENKRS